MICFYWNNIYYFHVFDIIFIIYQLHQVMSTIVKKKKSEMLSLNLLYLECKRLLEDLGKKLFLPFKLAIDDFLLLFFCWIAKR